MLPRACALAALVCVSCPDRDKVVVVWAAAAVQGTVAPCGCTTDPLGGLDHVAALIAGERRPHLLVIAGDLSPEDPAERATAETRAKVALLEQTFDRVGWWKGGIRELGGVKIAVGTAAGPADFVIGLVEKRRSFRGIDLAVAAAASDLGKPAAERAGDGWIVQPADQLQKLVRIELHVRPGGGRPVYAGGPGEIALLDQRIGSLTEQLARWERAPDADQAFVSARREELSAVRAERARRALTGGVDVPAHGSWFSTELVAIKSSLPSDLKVQAAMKQLYRVVGEDNRRRDCARPAGERREPHYVGMGSCGEGGCHPQAVELWKTTVHAHAWQTLVEDGRAFHQDCFGCHVTGGEDAAHGGATMCRPEPFVDVQCEVCHGPASAHVAAGGIEDRPTLTQRPPDDFCATRCHTPKHSDTFQLEAYLRDILGKGHGVRRRAQLGPGPTGHDLRQAGLKRAGRAK